MPSPEVVHLLCPECVEAVNVTVYRSIDNRLPDAADKVISGELFKYRCPHCGRKDRLEYDLSFHDAEHNAWIQVVHDPAQIPDYVTALNLSSRHQGLRVRIVHNIHEMREKTMTFVMGRDDRILEIYKYIAKAQFLLQSPDFVLTREPFYAGSAETGDEVVTFLGKGGKRELAPLDESYYQFLHTEFAGQIQAEAGRYVYDSAWAKEFAKGIV
ncbi:MAG: CpXC domain-containing protein [Oscillospiraceae bacterium]|nr:CpXC domain-containing protein [Oscillospiraceae bacterium]